MRPSHIVFQILRFSSSTLWVTFFWTVWSFAGFAIFADIQIRMLTVYERLDSYDSYDVSRLYHLCISTTTSSP